MTDQSLEEYLELLRSKGWRVELWDGAAPPALDAAFTLRYPKIPADYVQFLERVKSCVNADETVWFLCINDYNNQTDPDWAWTWNAMEEIELEGEKDERVRTEVVEFWDRHMPFMYAVGGEYGFLAFKVGAEPYGSVVEGYEIRAQVSERAKSFAEFVGLHSAALRGDDRKTTLFYYV